MASTRAAPHNNLNPSGGVKGLGNFKWNSSPILVKIGKSTPNPTPPVRKKKKNFAASSTRKHGEMWL